MLTEAEKILYGNERLCAPADAAEDTTTKMIGDTDEPISVAATPPLTAEPVSDSRWKRLRSYRRRRQLEAFHRQCDKLSVPDDARRRLLKMGGRPTAPDAWAGR